MSTNYTSGYITISKSNSIDMIICKRVKWIKILARVIIFVILFIFLCNFYLVGQLSDYFKHRTTVTSRHETKTSLEPPLITVCTEPTFKQSVGNEFGFWYNPDVYENKIPNLTFPQTFSKLSYILNRDYMIKLEYGDMIDDKMIVEGSNQIWHKTFIVQSIQTAYHGTCLELITLKLVGRNILKI